MPASRPPQLAASISCRRAIFASVLNAISFALFLASRAALAFLLRFDIIMRRFRLYMDSVRMPSPFMAARNSDLHRSYSACSGSVRLTRICCTSYLARCRLSARSCAPLRYTTPPTSRGIIRCSPSSRSSVAVSPRRNGAMHCSAINLYPGAGRWCASSNTSSPNLLPSSGARTYAESYVAIVTARTSFEPPPSNPTSSEPALPAAVLPAPAAVPPPRSPFARRCSRTESAHWWRRSMVGTTTSAGTAASHIAEIPTAVLPAPVGSITQPLMAARLHPSRASCW